MEQKVAALFLGFMGALAVTIVLMIGSHMVAEHNRPKKCINGVIMQQTERGWESESGRYARLCIEDPQ